MFNTNISTLSCRIDRLHLEAKWNHFPCCLFDTFYTTLMPKRLKYEHIIVLSLNGFLHTPDNFFQDCPFQLFM